MTELNKKALGLTAGTFSGSWWFLAMSFSLLTGVGETTMSTLGGFHPFFSYSWLGMVIIVAEHLIGGFLAGWAFAWLYNRLAK